MEHGVVRVRIVYDGPPLAGKTATLHALEHKLSSNRVVQPLNDTGVNLLEYQGGMYDQLPIACQIFTTPSDLRWSKRRQFLLNHADAIILILDTRPESLPLGLEYLRQLRDFLHQLPPPVPLFLIQANCQDYPHALNTATLHSFFIDPSIKIMETSAVNGVGIRETFVMAVRLAVERLNALKEDFKLFKGKCELINVDEWIEVLHTQQTDPENTALSLFINAPTPPQTSPKISNPHDIHADISEVVLPSPETPLKWLFPALSMQSTLSQLIDLSNIFEDQEGWIVTNQHWKVFSRADWHYLSENVAIDALQQQTHWHTQALFGLPQHRGLALSQSEQGWHLWQIAQRPMLIFSKNSADEFISQFLMTAKYISQTLQRLNKFMSISQIILEHFDSQGNFYGRLCPTEETLKMSSVDKTLTLCLPILTSATFEPTLLLAALEQQEMIFPQFAQLVAQHLT